MHDKAKAISAELLELDLKVQLYNPFFNIPGVAGAIGTTANLHCEAIELVCGGSPKVCALVEWKAVDRVKLEL